MERAGDLADKCTGNTDDRRESGRGKVSKISPDSGFGADFTSLLHITQSSEQCAPSQSLNTSGDQNADRDEEKDNVPANGSDRDHVEGLTAASSDILNGDGYTTPQHSPVKPSIPMAPKKKSLKELMEELKCLEEERGIRIVPEYAENSIMRIEEQPRRSTRVRRVPDRYVCDFQGTSNLHVTKRNLR